jgi:hypothetical protein
VWSLNCRQTPNPPHVSFSDYYALSIAATAVLFPLVLLIMDGSGSNDVSVFTRSEILLRHAFVFPISIMLLEILGLSAFHMNYYWMRITVVISVSLAGIVLFRLLHVLFGPKIWKGTEENLLKIHVHEAINQITRQRFGMINTFRELKLLEPYLTNFSISFGRDVKISQKKVLSDRIGRISSINFKIIESLIRTLKKEDLNIGDKNNDHSSLNMKEAKEMLPTFQIVLHVTRNEIFDKSGNVLATLKYQSDVFSEKEILNALAVISSAISIESNNESSFSLDQLDEVLSRLSHLSIMAVDNNNETLAKKIAMTYQSLVEFVLDAFEKLEIKDLNEDAKKENSFFENDWSPLTRTFENIRIWTEYVIQKKGSIRSVKTIVFYLPYQLALASFERKDIFTFASSLRIALHHNYITSENNYSTIGWLKSLCDYNLGRELEEEDREEQSQVVLSYLRAVFEIELNLAKNSIDSKNPKAFSDYLNLIIGHPKLFKYEDLDSEIDWRKSTVVALGTNEDVILNEDLKKIVFKYNLQKKVIRWQNELLIGLSAYCIYLLDGHGDPKLKISTKFLEDSFKMLIDLLPNSLTSILNLRIEMNKSKITDKWGWEWWGYIPDGEARFSSIPSCIDEVFAYLILKSNTSDLDDIADLNLQDNNTFDFRDGPESLLGKIQSLNQKANRFNIAPRTDEELKELKEKFNKIILQESLKSDLKLVSKKISNVTVLEFQNSFEENFTNKSRFRNFIRFTQRSVENLSSVKWGVSILVPREYFIETPPLNISEIGKHYSSDLASSEEKLIFKMISEKITKVDFCSISDILRKGVEKGFPESEMIIIYLRDPKNSRGLRNEPLFKNSPNEAYAGSDGHIDWQGINIPVFRINSREERTDGSPDLLLLNKAELKFIINVDYKNKEYLLRTGFSFKLIDPLEVSDDAEKLKADIIKRNPDWYGESDNDHKDKLIGKYIWMKILEDIELEKLEGALAFKVDFGLIKSD